MDKMDLLLKDATIVNEGCVYKGYVGINRDRIVETGEGSPSPDVEAGYLRSEDLSGRYLLPGVIDDQVHFRDPGLTHKADIQTESRTAAAGGVTSFMDMPNTKPQTVSIEAWEEKNRRAKDVSSVNYAFFIGATNQNHDELAKADFRYVPGVKVFLGASTGNMLVNDEEALEKIFRLQALIAIHSEDEGIIAANMDRFRREYPEGIPIACHPEIRSREACIVSTRRAIERAQRLNTRLHILHISTAEEAAMLSTLPLAEKRITAEVCVHHLWFTSEDYIRLGSRIKWNPAIKDLQDRTALREAAADGRIDIVATDHAPHLLSEKAGGCEKAASGGPLIQHSLQMMLDLSRKGIFSIEKVVDLMAHRPAELYGIKERGYIRPGYYADLTVVDPSKEYEVSDITELSKCGWSPISGVTLSHTVTDTFVNGKRVFSLEHEEETPHPMPLEFVR